MYIVNVLLHVRDENSEIMRQYICNTRQEAEEVRQKLKEKYSELYGNPNNFWEEHSDDKDFGWIGFTFYINQEEELGVCAVMETNSIDELDEDASKFDIMSNW